MCVLVTELCLILCDSIDYSPLGSPVHGILQTRILEWVAISFSKGIFLTKGSNPDLLHCRRILYCLSHQEAPFLILHLYLLLPTLLFPFLPFFFFGQPASTMTQPLYPGSPGPWIVAAALPGLLHPPLHPTLCGCILTQGILS